MRPTRTIISLSLAAAICAGGSGDAMAARSRVIRHHGPCSGRMAVERPSMASSLILRRVTKLIRCAEARWPVAGGVAEALRVAHRESGEGLWPWSRNPSGASGIYQHLRTYFAGRANRWLKPAWFPRMRHSSWTPSPFNARASVIVTMRWVHSAGSWCVAWC